MFRENFGNFYAARSVSLEIFHKFSQKLLDFSRFGVKLPIERNEKYMKWLQKG